MNDMKLDRQVEVLSVVGDIDMHFCTYTYSTEYENGFIDAYIYNYIQT